MNISETIARRENKAVFKIRAWSIYNKIMVDLLLCDYYVARYRNFKAKNVTKVFPTLLNLKILLLVIYLI